MRCPMPPQKQTEEWFGSFVVERPKEPIVYKPRCVVIRTYDGVVCTDVTTVMFVEYSE